MSRPGWLQERLSASPEPLRSRLTRTVEELGDDADSPEAMVAEACRLLESVRGRLQRREAAFDLLVADGLLTLACEAAAAGSEDVVERCRAMGPCGALGDLARSWAGRS